MSKVIVSNAKTLNKSLIEAFNDLNKGTLKLQTAKEMANTAGKIIKLNVGRMDYAKITNSKAKIDFWEED